MMQADGVAIPLACLWQNCKDATCRVFTVLPQAG